MTLQELKDLRYKEIDSTSGYLIKQGFSFGGFDFSLSENAQINWTNLNLLPDEVYPVLLSTNSEDTYTLQLADRDSFYMTAVTKKLTSLNSGTQLKKLIYDCVDEDCVNAVEDTRI
jgi:hypothetical protein